MAMARNIGDFYEAWWFLHGHPAFSPDDYWYFQRCLDIDVAKVDPVTRRIEGDIARNVHTEVWLECGRPYDRNAPECVEERRCWNDGGSDAPLSEADRFGASHDIDLDCGGDTFEQAIVVLANLVLQKYGDYPEED